MRARRYTAANNYQNITQGPDDGEGRSFEEVGPGKNQSKFPIMSVD
jgi:hypothetical protein